MPELPEVESIKRSLSSNIVGQKLENYKIYDHRTNRYNTKKPTIKESLSGICNIVSIDIPSLFRFEVISASTPGISFVKILK